MQSISMSETSLTSCTRIAVDHRMATNKSTATSKQRPRRVEASKHQGARMDNPSREAISIEGAPEVRNVCNSNIDMTRYVKIRVILKTSDFSSF